MSTAAGMFELPASCREGARLVDAELEAFLSRHRAQVGDRGPGVAGAFQELARVIHSGGKRLRPVFCLLGHRAAAGEDTAEALRVASALELLHTFAIVHDDVMDRSPSRRGAPSSWAHVAEEHRRAGLRGDPEGYGVSVAVLVGDLALILADEAFLDSGAAPERLLPAFRRYNDMRARMVAGQYLDVLAAHRGDAQETEARRIAVLKSGAYTVEGPLHIGATLGGGSPRLLEGLSRYGVALGEAFQLRDDVLGVFGDPGQTGKDRDSDLREGKRTLLVARALAGAGEGDRRFLQATLGRADASPEDLDRARAILDSTGALSSTLELIDELSARARDAIDADVIPPSVAADLAELAGAIAVRRA